MSSVEEKTEAKPIDSEYYKWSKKINESKKELERLGVDTAPTRIEGGSSEQATSPTTGVSRSAWNQAGTWEEMDLSKWAKKRIPEILKEGEFQSKGYCVRIEDVEKCEGQATYVFVKGKKRPGYDLSLKLKWSATCPESDTPANGTVTINDFSDTAGGDYEWSFKANSSDGNHVKAKSAVQACKRDIQNLLEKWIDEFKNF